MNKLLREETKFESLENWLKDGSNTMGRICPDLGRKTQEEHENERVKPGVTPSTPALAAGLAIYPRRKTVEVE